MEIAIGLIYTLIFVVIIRKASFFNDSFLTRNILVGFFSLKLLVAVILFLIYTYYYTDRTKADIYKYYDDSKVLFDAFWTNPLDFFKILFGLYSDNEYFTAMYFDKMTHWLRIWERSYFNDNHTVIRINAVLRFISFGCYSVHSIVFCFFSFTGLFALYKGLKRFFNSSELILGVIIFLTPSVLFWTSGVLKESLLFLGLGFFVWSLFNFTQPSDNSTFYKFQFHKILELRNIKTFIIFFFSSLLLGIIKYYVLAVFLPVIVSYFIAKKVKNSLILPVYLITISFFSVLTFSMKYISQQLDIIHIFYKKQDDFIRHAIIEKTGSLLNVTPMNETAFSFMRNIPEALYHTYILPFFNVFISNPFILLSSFENLAILILLIFCIKYRKPMNEINWNLFFLFTFFTFLLYIIIGWTTPVLGAIVRYKIPGLLFMIISFLLIRSQNPESCMKEKGIRDEV